MRLDAFSKVLSVIFMLTNPMMQELSPSISLRDNWQRDALEVPKIDSQLKKDLAFKQGSDVAYGLFRTIYYALLFSLSTFFSSLFLSMGDKRGVPFYEICFS